MSTATMSAKEAVGRLQDLRAATSALPDVLARLSNTVSGVLQLVTAAANNDHKTGVTLQAFSQLEGLLAKLADLEGEIVLKTNEKKQTDAKAWAAYRNWMDYITTIAKHEHDSEDVLGPQQRAALADIREKIAQMQAQGHAPGDA